MWGMPLKEAYQQIVMLGKSPFTTNTADIPKNP